MKFKLTAIALSLISIGVAQAESFSLDNANLDNLNKKRWKCRRCKADDTVGTVGASIVFTKDNQAVLANKLGENSNQTAALQANINRYNKEDGSRIKVRAKNLGLDSGYGNFTIDNKNFDIDLGYSNQLKVHSDKAKTPYAITTEDKIVNTGNQKTATLSKKRETLTVDVKLDFDNWGGYLSYKNQEKTGQKVGSFFRTRRLYLVRNPANFVKPIDHVTHTFKAGAQTSGEDWLAGIDYQGSFFDNNNKGLYNGEVGSVHAYEPDNKAHRIGVNGQYRFDDTRITATAAKGWMYQDQKFIDNTGVPKGITHANAKVETFDTKLKVSSRLSRSLKVSARYDYSDRDNKTPIFALCLQKVLHRCQGHQDKTQA